MSLRDLIYGVGSQQDDTEVDDNDDDDDNAIDNNENQATNHPIHVPSQDINATKVRGKKRSLTDEDDARDNSHSQGSQPKKSRGSQRVSFGSIPPESERAPARGSQRVSFGASVSFPPEPESVASSSKKRKGGRFVLDSDQDSTDDEYEAPDSREKAKGKTKANAKTAPVVPDATPSSNDNQNPKDASNKMSAEFRLDALFTNTADAAATATASIPDAAFLHSLPPVRVPKPPKLMYRKEGGQVKNPEACHMATAEQVAERKARYKLTQEWAGVRLNWKTRKYDLRTEQDVGGAIEYAAKQGAGKRKAAAMAKCDQSDKAQASVAATANDGDDGNKSDYADTSDEEQGNILNRLMQSSQQAQEERAKPAPQVNVNDGKADLRPYAERLDAWEYGRNAPRPQDLDFNYTPYRTEEARKLPPRKSGRPKSRLLAPVDDFGVTMPTLRKDHVKVASMDCFPMSHAQYCFRLFTHRRQILAMAARHIVGAAGKCIQGDDAAIENRMLRAIWDKEMVYCHRSRLVLNQALQHGMNLHFFLKHQWKDRRFVVERLGVLPDSQMIGSDLTPGSTMNQGVSNQSMGVTDRAKLVKDCALGGLAWQPEAMVDGEETNAKEPNQASVVDDITPLTSYLSVPGTIPPIPNFPLDESGIIFGPKDKHTHVYYNGPVDECTYVLTLSSLLSRLATAHLEGEDAVEEKLREQIQSMIEQTVELNQTGMHKRLWMRRKSISELPLASYYKALMGYCNLMANGYPQKNVIAGKDAGDDSDSDRSDDEMKEPGQATMNTVAQRMFDFCQPLIDHNGLQLFSRLHVTFALLRISKILPESAVAILSSPFDNHQFRTPFDIIRCLLEHLEENYLLVDNLSSSAGGEKSSEIHVGELEYAFHQASEIFARCVERGPTVVDYHAWYIGTLAGSLLLCSGNRIGSGARKCPSSYVYRKERQSLMLLEGGNTPSQTHEVRRMLPKFQELRRETAQAFQLLMHLERHQQAARTHLSVSSFLEWREVIALVVGPTKGKRNPFRAIQTLHDETVVKWTLQERSTASLNFLQCCESSLDDRLDGYAASLEGDPCDLNHWRAFVSELGPLGFIVSDERAAECTFCDECERLHEDLNVPHASLQRRKEKGSWWGRNRHEWWDSHLLHLSGSDPSKTVEGWPIICKALKKKFGDLLPDESSHGLLDGDDDDGDDNDIARSSSSSSRSLPSFEWLDAVIHAPDPVARADNRPEKVPSATLRNQTHDEQLPKTFLEVCEMAKSRPERNEHYYAKTTLPLLLTEEGSSSSPADAATEILCYKVLIACHLYGVLHPIVQIGVRTLGVESWDRIEQRVRPAEQCLAVRCLAWLHHVSNVGLNVSLMVGDVVYEYKISDTFTTEMQQTLKDGVTRFGYGNWRAMHKHYPLFASQKKAFVRVRYVTLYYFLFVIVCVVRRN
jgi:hypothetical protein